jgi:hypothetical protein
MMVVAGDGRPSLCPRAHTLLPRNLNGPLNNIFPGVYACLADDVPVASSSPSFVLDVAVATGLYEADIQCPAGFMVVQGDVNQGTDGHVVQLCIKTGPPYGKALKDLEVVYGDASCPTGRLDGTYIMLPENLNEGATVDGVNPAVPAYLCKLVTGELFDRHAFGIAALSLATRLIAPLHEDAPTYIIWTEFLKTCFILLHTVRLWCVPR